MTKVKICGLSRDEDIAYVNEARPDFAGFIINVPSSRRNISPKRLKELANGLDKKIKAVGVFVDAPIELVRGLLESGVIALAQLHGHEDSDYIREIGANQVIQAIKVKCKEDVKRANESAAKMVLLDGGSGDGKVFDWSLLSEVHRPFMLAGGLNLENIPQAMETLSPWGIDLSSSVESEGVKDRSKILQTVDLVRKTDERMQDKCRKGDLEYMADSTCPKH